MAITFPAASMTGTPGAAVNAGGIMTCISCIKLTKYPDHPAATTEAAKPYSSSSNSPMIHAAPSPMEA